MSSCFHCKNGHRRSQERRAGIFRVMRSSLILTVTENSTLKYVWSHMFYLRVVIKNEIRNTLLFFCSKNGHRGWRNLKKMSLPQIKILATAYLEYTVYCHGLLTTVHKLEVLVYSPLLARKLFLGNIHFSKIRKQRYHYSATTRTCGTCTSLLQ